MPTSPTLTPCCAGSSDKTVALDPTDDSVLAAKRELRHIVLARRDVLSLDLRRQLSARISAKLITLDDYRSAHCVLAYCSFGSEFLTRDFIDSTLSLGKRLVMPKVDRAHRALQLFYVESVARQLLPGVWGILEPDPQQCEAAPPMAVDWILVPGVAFDANCQRLGYGGGYYDKLLPLIPPQAVRVAAAFSTQIVEEVPTAEHDQLLNLVITEDHALIRFARATPKYAR